MTPAKTTPRTETSEPATALRDYVVGVEDCLDRRPAMPALIKEVSVLTKGIVQDGSWLGEEHRRSSPDHYTRHLLHRDRKNRFIVLSVVWLPGQGTPIHDHGCWGVMGVVDGELEVINYERMDDGTVAGHAEVREASGIETSTGGVSYVLPPYHEIHRVANRSERPTLTVHIYGRDIDEVSVFDLESRKVSQMRMKYFSTDCGDQDFVI
jgi:predicted metal-dependent enzyme (double-stranded beta helix superfamily)